MFDFENLDVVPTDEYIGVGDWDCMILEAKGDRSSGGYPQVNCRFHRADGATKPCWLVYGTEFGARRLVTLADAAGVRRPRQGVDVTAEGELTEDWINLLNGKSVKLLVRPDRKDPTKPPECWNFTKPDAPVSLTGGRQQVPLSSGRQQPAADPLAGMPATLESFVAPAGGAADDDIPF